MLKKKDQELGISPNGRYEYTQGLTGVGVEEGRGPPVG
jgi:hypothetical protein